MSQFIALMYHSLKDPPTGGYSVSLSEFKAQLAWLKAEGFTIEGFAELERRLIQGDFPEHYIVMTFDDGHKSSLPAAEILREADAQATFFLTKEACQNRANFLSAHEIRELSTLCSVGSHGVTHLPLTKIGIGRLRWELAESKKWLEDLVNKPINLLSAPGGYINSRVVRHALDLGYSLLGNSVEWWNQTPQVAAQRVVNRIAVRSSFLMPTFKKIVRGERIFFLKRRLRSSLLAIPKTFLSGSGVCI